MFYDLRAVIDAITANGTAFVVANQARPGNNYVLASILPPENRSTYHISGGNLTIRATMAGMVGMDSPYPGGGAAEKLSFEEQTIKLANDIRFPEEMLRELQAFLAQIGINGGGDPRVAIQSTALNFYNKVVIQGHLDTEEWLRGQALTLGKIDWVFNSKHVEVDYQIPAANFLTARTGNDGYGGSISKLWTDLRAGRRLLNSSVRLWLMHPDTKEMLLANPANNFKLLSESDTGFSGVRFVTVQSTLIESTDPRDRASFLTYGEEGEIWDLASPGKTVKMPFFPRGVILGVGNSVGSRFVVGQGSTRPVTPNQIGYTHIAPTTEGYGRPGRWGRLFTPENEPWSFAAQAVTNLLPVIEAPDRLVILTTEMV